LPVNTENPF